MEYKSVPSFTSKDIDGRTVTGLAAIFGNVDAFGDRIFKGAFKKTIKENSKRVKHLWQHDGRVPPVAAIKEMVEVGRGSLPQEVKDAFPEAKGGLQVTRDYLDTPRGSEVLEGIKSGAINEMSFAFDTIKVDFEGDADEKQIRNLRELKLWDTSDVNWGMNEATVAAKSAAPFKIIELVKTLQAVRELNADTLATLTEQLKDVEVETIELIRQLLTSAEPSQTLTEKAPDDMVLLELQYELESITAR